MSGARIPQRTAIPVPTRDGPRFDAFTSGPLGSGSTVSIEPVASGGSSSSSGSNQSVLAGSGATTGVSQVIPTSSLTLPSGITPQIAASVATIGPATPPTPTPPTLLPPRGVLQSFFRARGYVPLSDLKAQTAYGQQLQSSIASAKSQVASLNASLAALGSTVNPLSAKVTSLQQQISNLQSQIAALQSQVPTLTSGVARSNSTAQALTAQVATLKANLGSGGAGGSLASIQAQIAALAASVTGVAANPTDSVVSTNKSQDSGDPMSTAVGFGPTSLSFFPGFQGMTTTSGKNLDVRYSVLGGASGGAGGIVGAPVARVLGYVPISQITTAIGQETVLATQLGSYTSQIQTLKAQNAALISQGNLLLGLIPTLQSQITSLTATRTALQNTVATLQANASNLANAIAALQQLVAQLTAQAGALGKEINTQYALLQSWQSGSSHFPMSVAWSFGDGGTSTAQAPTYTLNPGSFNPTVTITITTPDGKVWVHTFKLPMLLIGQWPASIYSNSRSGQTLNFLVLDRNGMAIPNNRVSVRYQVPDLKVDKVNIVTVGSNGSFSETLGAIGSGVPWTLTVRSLRNPSVVFTTNGT